MQGTEGVVAWAEVGRCGGRRGVLLRHAWALPAAAHETTHTTTETCRPDPPPWHDRAATWPPCATRAETTRWQLAGSWAARRAAAGGRRCWRHQSGCRRRWQQPPERSCCRAAFALATSVRTSSLDIPCKTLQPLCHPSAPLLKSIYSKKTLFNQSGTKRKIRVKRVAQGVSDRGSRRGSQAGVCKVYVPHKWARGTWQADKQALSTSDTTEGGGRVYNRSRPGAGLGDKQAGRRKVSQGGGKTGGAGLQGVQNEECKGRMPKLRCACRRRAGACRGWREEWQRGRGPRRGMENHEGGRPGHSGWCCALP